MGFAKVLVLAHVELFVDRLQFGVKEAQRQVAEAFPLEGYPAAEFVAGDVVDVDGLLDPGVGVGAFGADGGDEAVVFVGGHQQGCLVAQLVDFSVQHAAFVLVLGTAVDFEEVGDLLQQRTFLLPVGGANLAGSLKEHVLHVVGQAGGVGGVVLGTYPETDVGKNTGLVVVHTQEDLQAIGQRVLAYAQRVAGDVFVAVRSSNRVGHSSFLEVAWENYLKYFDGNKSSNFLWRFLKISTHLSFSQLFRKF